MTYAQNVWLYTVLLFGIIAVPGMDMFFVIANALTGGKPAGIAAMLGINLGAVWLTVFGAVFVGVLSAMAPQLITVILLASAAYMAWIGYTLIRSSITVGSIGGAPRRSRLSAFVQGFVTCSLNPKAYMFVLSVYPVFIQPRFGPVWMQATVMGLLGVLMQIAVYGSLAVAAAKAREFLTGNPQVTINIGRTCGLLFFGVAGFTVWHALNG